MCIRDRHRLEFDHPTLVRAANGDVVVKTIVMEAIGVGLVVAVLQVKQRIHLQNVAAALGVGRARLRLLEEHELVPRCGFARQCIGPLVRNHATVMVETELVGDFLCGAGAPEWHFRTCRMELCAKLSAIQTSLS